MDSSLEASLAAHAHVEIKEDDLYLPAGKAPVYPAAPDDIRWYVRNAMNLWTPKGEASPNLPIPRFSTRARMFGAITLRPADRADDHSASYEANNFVVCDAWNSRGGPPVKLRAICFIFAYVWDAEENDLDLFKDAGCESLRVGWNLVVTAGGAHVAMLPMPDPSDIQVVGACSEKTPKAWELNKEGCAIIADLFGTNGSSFAGLKPLKSVSSLL